MRSVFIFHFLSEFVAVFCFQIHISSRDTSLMFAGRTTEAVKQQNSIKSPSFDPSLYWDLNRIAFSLLPLAPGPRRKTILSEIVPNSIWTQDQIQGIVNVNVPVRATIVKLKEGGLFVHNPVAPTKECVSMIKELEKLHGPVKYIVLGTVGLEHKALAGPFSQYFPKASIWLQPGQWSFPLNLPNIFLGFPLGSDIQEIPQDSSLAPWHPDIDHESLGPLFFKSVGGFSETAFFHRDTKTLLVTDAVIEIRDEPPEILQEDPRALLFHARDAMLEDVEDNSEARRRGWRRLALFGLTFFPSGIKVSTISETLKKLRNVKPEMKLLGRDAIPFDGGLYPWSWVKSEEKNFRALQGGLLVAPILRKLILNREPARVLAWADRVSRWPIQRVIPGHFSNNIRSTGQEFRRAFSFLETETSGPQPLADDLALLDQLSDIFTRLGVVAPAEAPVPVRVSPQKSLSFFSSLFRR